MTARQSLMASVSLAGILVFTNSCGFCVAQQPCPIIAQPGSVLIYTETTYNQAAATPNNQPKSNTGAPKTTSSSAVAVRLLLAAPAAAQNPPPALMIAATIDNNPTQIKITSNGKNPALKCNNLVSIRATDAAKHCDADCEFTYKSDDGSKTWTVTGKISMPIKFSTDDGSGAIWPYELKEVVAIYFGK